jgi:hypothetical protein
MRGVASYDISIQRGADQSLQFALRNDDGSVFSLVGSVLSLFANIPHALANKSNFNQFDGLFTQVNLNSDGSGILFSPSVNNIVITIDNAAQGLFTINFTLDQSNLVPAGNVARYEIKRVISGLTETLIEGFLDGYGLGVK